MDTQRQARTLRKFPIIIPINFSPYTESMKKAELCKNENEKLRGVNPYMIECYKLIKLMKQHNFCYFFEQPVNPQALHIPDYYSIIRRPMDLKTIELKILQRNYSKPQNFDKDMRLMFNNALIYNQHSPEIILQIKEFSSYYQLKYDELRNRFSREKLINEREIGHIEVRSKQSERIEQFRRYFFTQEKLQELGRRLAMISEQGRLEIRIALHKKFPDIKRDADNIILTSLKTDQLLYLVELAKQYPIQNYGCNEKLLQLAKNKKQQIQEQSSFQIQDESS